MFGWFWRKKEVEKLKEDTKRSFDSVKNDINKTGKWIDYLNKHDNELKNEISEIKGDLSTVKDELEQVKELLSMFDAGISKQLSKRLFNKQTAVYGVQTPVQTAVQSPKFSQFSALSTTERAIVWTLANSDMKLSYDDLAAVLGKSKVTIRGQINAIKQKNEGLVLEQAERNGKKRLYIPEEIKEKLLKNVKVRVKKARNKEKLAF